MKKVNVMVFGPNLRDQSKGAFHVHAVDCADRKHYGPTGKKFGGEEGLIISVNTRKDVAADIYADQIAEAPAYKASHYLKEFFFAPCIAGVLS